MRHRRHRGNVSNCCVRSCPRSLSPSMPQSGRPRCEIIWHSGGCTALEMTLTKSGGHFRATDEDTVELVRRACRGLRRHHHRADPVQAAPPHRHRRVELLAVQATGSARFCPGCLQAAFRRYLDTTPPAHLRSVRMARATECRSFALELHASICTDLNGDFHSHFLTVSALCLRP
jgi:hypothetical protein